MQRSAEELTELENRYHVIKGGLAPIFYATGLPEEPFLVFYGTKKPWPPELNCWVLCKACDNRNAIDDGQVLALAFETHLYSEHGMSADSYVSRYGTHEFPVWLE